tara:strand:- start:1830 stop:2519 length:690 start_codon:yes stop_codon:yes gene_type:complete
MKNIKKIVFIVQARKNSQRVPNKMIKPIGNSCLFEIYLKKIKNTIIPLDQFYASVYDKELKDICSKNNVKIFHRSLESRNTDNNLSLMYEWWDKFPQYEFAILLNPCFLFLSANTINNFIEEYCSNNFPGLFGVIRKKQYYWGTNGELITPWPVNTTIMNTKIVSETYEAAHALYAGKLSEIGKGVWMGNFKKNNPKLFLMEEKECLDIDYLWQFDLYSSYYLLNKQHI